MKYALMCISALLTVLLLWSCNKEDENVVSTSTRIVQMKIKSPAERIGIVDHGSKKISFTAFKAYTDISLVSVEIEVSPEATVFPESGTLIDFRSGPVTFTVTNGSKQTVYTATVIVEPPIPIAFLGPYSLSKDITEPDMLAAYTYLKKYYGADLKYLSIKNINEYSLENVRVIYYYQDSDSIANFKNALPVIAKNNSIIDALKIWQSKGGNMILAGYATQYLYYLDRLKKIPNVEIDNNPYAPLMFASSNGSWSSTQGGVKYNISENQLPNTTWDHNNALIYQSLYKDSIDNVAPIPAYFNYKYFPLQSYGFKEGTMMSWDLKKLGELSEFSGLASDQVALKFQEDLQCTILGSEAGQISFSNASVVYFYKREGDNYKDEGAFFAFGGNSYDWDQGTIENMPDWYMGSKTNAHITNVQRMTVNAIDLLLK